MTLLSLGIIDCIINNKWRDYGLLLALVGMISGYLIYSNFVLHFNTFYATLADAIIEMKSYVAFAVVLAIRPSFSSGEKVILKWLALVNVLVSVLVLLLGNEVTIMVMQHPYVAGTTIFISSLVYIFVCDKRDGALSKQDLTVVVVMILSGVLCGRAKYFGEAVLLLYFLFVYKPGFLKHLSVGHLCAVLVLVLAVLAVGWQKLDYYFISGNADATRFDPEVIESFARPVLYLTGGLILIDYFPFGTGLASYASAPSKDPYSGVYHEYGIDKVYGLSESMPDFICDAYYPLLAQFGVFGIVMFVWFWVYAYSYLRTLIRANAERYRYQIVIGINIILFLLIESVGGNTLAQGPGVASMMLLGYVCGQGAKIRDEQNEEKLELQSVTKKYI